MRILVDTNILLRLDHVGHPHREIANEVLELFEEKEYELRSVPQVLYEYWSVVTRPVSVNGFGFSTSEAEKQLVRLRSIFQPLRDDRGVLDRWQDLVVRYQVQGKVSHDARLVAAMLRHGVSHVLTFNDKDFARFTEVEAWNPAAVLAGDVAL